MGVTVVEGVNVFDGVIIDDEGGCVTMDEDVVGLVYVVELVGVVDKEVRVGVAVASVGVTVGVIMGDTVAILGSSRASTALPLGKATALVGAKVAAKTNATLMNLEYMVIWWIVILGECDWMSWIDGVDCQNLWSFYTSAMNRGPHTGALAELSWSNSVDVGSNAL